MKSVFSKGSILLLLAAAILLGGCSLLGLDEEEDSGPSTVDPADAEALTDALVVPSGASIVDGSLSGYVSGSAVSGSNDTTLTVDSSSITMANGGSYALNLTSSGSNAVAGVALQVSGSGRYYQIPQSAGANATFSINVGLPTNVGSGSFTLILVLYDSSGSGSNGVSLPVTVEQVGTGALQVQLTWNTDNTDLDLHIVEPGGDRIYYGDPEGDQSGGELDVDDTNGRGPENIFFDSTPPDGTYAVSVDYYYGSTSTDYTVVISAGGDTLATLTGTLASSAAAEANVADIVVSGGSITVNN